MSILDRFQKKEAEELTDERQPIRRIQTPVELGLTDELVAERIDAGWDNRSVAPPSKTTKEIIKSNCLTYFNILFLILAVLVVCVQSWRSLTFLPVIIANTLIGIIQELQAKKTLDNLTMLNAPKAKVVRNKKLYTVNTEDLVIDDIVLFEAGNQICADAIVQSGEVQVNESLLTGEADEITKRPGDMLMSGSFVVSGQCFARLEKVGEDSYISQLTLQAKASKDGEQSEMVRSLNRLLVIIGILIIPIGITLIVQQSVFAHASAHDSITSMVAAVIGMIPEGLFLLTSVTLAVSVIRLASKKVLVHDMKCIETLARVNILCVDKTGTITENTMEVNDVVSLPAYNADRMPPLHDSLSDFAAAMNPDNITMEALQKYFNTPTGMTARSVTSFSSAYKYSSATFQDGSYVLGAPEFVLGSGYAEHREVIEKYSSKGYRVLVYGKTSVVPTGKALQAPVTALALILLSNPVRKDAPDTFRYFEEQDVQIKVISGDNPVTVCEVAKQAGISGAEKYVDATTLRTDEDIREAVVKYNVFGRVTPDQKRKFVRALKAAGNTVAMTGDGVNDVLALKDADCSVAMASGSDAAAQAAQLVLLESDFARMPDVVAEGRRVVNNMERSGSLFLVKNIFSLLMSVFSIIFALSYPLEPSQISLISMFTIGFPGFFMSQVPNKKRIEGKFITNILLKALPAGLTDALIVGALVVFGKVFDVGSVDISTACTILLSIVGFMILYQIMKPMDAFRWAIWIASVVAMLFCGVFLRNLFGIYSMSVQCIMLFVVFAILTEPLFRYLTIIVEKARLVFNWIRDRIFEMIRKVEES